MAAKSGAVKRIVVKQIKSQIGRDGTVRDALKALGLGRIGKSKEFNVGPEIVGIIRQVSHLVSIDDVK
jgi:large subunit ribosomal protein L30